MNNIEYSDDGLFLDKVGMWAIRKHKLISKYAYMFSTSMKNKWQHRVYIDLFASSGLAKIKGTKKIVPTSPLLSIDIKDKFDKYIFCDIEEEKIFALHKRIEKYFPEINVSYIIGDINENVEAVLYGIPKHSRQNKVLSFCVVDPFKIKNIRFSTIEELSTKFIDFLILIPTYMDINRNMKTYLNPDNHHVDNFLGYDSWRNDWIQNQGKYRDFVDFILKKLNERMVNLNFLPLKRREYVLIKHPKKNIPLYHLAFYSRNNLGKKFWREAIKYSDDQRSLFDL